MLIQNNNLAAEPISRILFLPCGEATIIPLGQPLLTGSSDLPGTVNAPSQHVHSG